MIFAFLVLASAFLIEGIGTYVSVEGLSALFAQNPVIIILAIALDLGKIVSISFLYKYWKKINILMKSYMVISAIVLMIITSTGCFGYLSGQFSRAISGTNQDIILTQSLEQEQSKLQARKQEIDAQIAKLPDNSVRGRKQLIAQFKPEEDQINSRLTEISKQLPQLKIESVKKNVDVGPIIYVAQAFNTDPEHAVKWVILTIIFVFDPLAVALLLAGNFLLAQREEKKIDAPSLSPEKLVPAQEDLQYFKNPPLHDNSAPASYALPVTPPEELEKPKVWDFEVVKLPDPTHEELGRERYQENHIDKFDYLTHEDLGRQKPNDPFEDHVNSSGSDNKQHVDPVTDSQASREVISLDQLRTPPKQTPIRSQLENIKVRGDDVIMQDDSANSKTSSNYKNQHAVKIR